MFPILPTTPRLNPPPPTRSLPKTPVKPQLGSLFDDEGDSVLFGARIRIEPSLRQQARMVKARFHELREAEKSALSDRLPGGRPNDYFQQRKIALKARFRMLLQADKERKAVRGLLKLSQSPSLSEDQAATALIRLSKRPISHENKPL